jgi:hypothetical protein
VSSRDCTCCRASMAASGASIAKADPGRSRREHDVVRRIHSLGGAKGGLRLMPRMSRPRSIAERTAARMTAFRPGASPPPGEIAIRIL